MEDYLNATGMPWFDVRAQILSVVLGEGVKGIGDNAFVGLSATSVSIPEGVTSIDANAFDGVTFVGKPPVIYCSEGSGAEAWALFNGYRTCSDSWESACTLRYSGTIALDVGESLTLERGSFALSPIPTDYRGELTLESADLAVDGVTVTAQAPGDVTLTARMDSRFSVDIPVHVYQLVERIALQAPTLCQAGKTFSVSVLELALQDISGRLTWTQDGAHVYEGNELTQTLTAPAGQTITVIRVTAPGGASAEATVRVPTTISAPTLGSSTVELGSLVEICADIDGETVVNDPETYGAISLGSSTTGLRLEGRLVRVTAMGKHPFTVTSLSGQTKYFTVTAQDTLHACRTQAPAKEATCTEAGSTAYEICQGCGKFFVLDGEGIAEVKKDSWVIPKLSYHRMDNHACVKCGEQFDFASMNILTLPAGLKHIEEEAFRGSTAQVVVVSEGCQSIGQDAFADCRELRYAVLPAALTDNAEKIFGANVPVLIVVCSGDAD